MHLGAWRRPPRLHPCSVRGDGGLEVRGLLGLFGSLDPAMDVVDLEDNIGLGTELCDGVTDHTAIEIGLREIALLSRHFSDGLVSETKVAE